MRYRSNIQPRVHLLKKNGKKLLSFYSRKWQTLCNVSSGPISVWFRLTWLGLSVITTRECCWRWRAFRGRVDSQLGGGGGEGSKSPSRRRRRSGTLLASSRESSRRRANRTLVQWPRQGRLVGAVTRWELGGRLVTRWEPTFLLNFWVTAPTPPTPTSSFCLPSHRNWKWGEMKYVLYFWTKEYTPELRA